MKKKKQKNKTKTQKKPLKRIVTKKTLKRLVSWQFHMLASHWLGLFCVQRFSSLTLGEKKIPRKKRKVDVRSEAEWTWTWTWTSKSMQAKRVGGARAKKNTHTRNKTSQNFQTFLRIPIPTKANMFFTTFERFQKQLTNVQNKIRTKFFFVFFFLYFSDSFSHPLVVASPLAFVRMVCVCASRFSMYVCLVCSALVKLKGAQRETKVLASTP